jgi:hypothetical protein
MLEVFGLAELLCHAVAVAWLVQLVLALAHAWREGSAGEEVLAAFGDHQELRLQITPLLMTTLVLALFWPFGTFGLMAPVVEYSLRWHHDRRPDARPLAPPREGHLGVSVLQVGALTAIGVMVGDVLARVAVPLQLPLAGAPLGGALGLVGLVWGAQRVTGGAAPLLPWVTLLSWAVWSGGEAPATEEEAPRPAGPTPAERARRAHIDDEAARAAAPVSTEGGVEDARVAAQRLAQAAIARELRAIAAEEERARREAAARAPAAVAAPGPVAPDGTAAVPPTPSATPAEAPPVAPTPSVVPGDTVAASPGVVAPAAPAEPAAVAPADAAPVEAAEAEPVEVTAEEDEDTAEEQRGSAGPGGGG